VGGRCDQRLRARPAPDLDSGTLTPLLKRLEASGWVERQRDSADERRVRVHLTPSGRALKARAAKVPPQVLCATGCSLTEIAALTAQLKALRDEIQSFSQAAAA